MKKLLSVVLCVAMLVTSLCVFTLPASASTTTVFKFTFEDPNAESILIKGGVAPGDIVEWPEGSGNHCLRYELNAENRTGAGGAHPYIWPVGIGNALVAQGDLEDTGSEIELKVDFACSGSTQGSYMYPFILYNDEEENFADHSVYAPGSGKFNTGIFNWSQYEAGAPVSGLSNGGICFCDEVTLPKGSYMYIDNIEFNWVGEWQNVDDLFIGYPNGTPCEESDLEMGTPPTKPTTEPVSQKRSGVTQVYKFTFEDPDAETILKKVGLAVGEIVEWPEGSGNHCLRYELNAENRTGGGGAHPYIWPVGIGNALVAQGDLEDTGSEIELKIDMACDGSTQGSYMYPFMLLNDEEENYADHSVYAPGSGKFNTGIFNWTRYDIGAPVSGLSNGGICFCDEGTLPEGSYMYIDNIEFNWVGEWNDVDDFFIGYPNGTPCEESDLEIDPSDYDEDVVLQVANVTVEEGTSQVEVPVNVVKNSGIWAFIAEINYDPSVLDFYDARSQAFNITPNESTPGVLKLVLDAKDSEDYTNQSGTMFTMIFDVVGTGKSKISMTFPDPESNITVDWYYPDMAAIDGSVTVSSEPTESGEVDLQIADVTVEAGTSQVDVPVNVVKNDGIWAFIAEINYDPSVLDFYDARSQAFIITPNETTPGVVKVVLDAKEMEDYTAQSGTMFTLIFDVVGTGTSEISMTFPDTMSNRNVDFGCLAMTAISGSVTVEGETSICGDANGDGVINMKDVLVIRKFIVGINVTIDTTAANCYDDGVVNAKDELWLRQLLAVEPNPRSDDSGDSFAVAFDNVEIDTNASTVEVPLNITQNDGVWAFLMDMSYDTELLKFDKVESEKFNITPYESTPGSVRMLFDAKEIANVTDVNTQVAVFTFSVVGNEYDGFEAMIHGLCPDPASNIDVTYNEVEMSIASGSVTMTEPHTDVVNDPESRAVYNLMLDNMVVSTNSSVIQMPLYGFMRAKTFMVDITYDASHLIYAGIEGCKNYTVAVVESFPGTYRLQFTVKEDERVAFAREHGGSDDYWWEDVVGFLTFTPQQVFPELLTSVTAVSSRNNTNNQNYDGSSCVVTYDGGDIKFAAPKPNSDGEIALAFDDVVMEEYASTVKVPLYITNNCGNWAFIIEMNYDPSVLRFSGISSLFYNITVNEFEPGRVKMVFDAKKMENVPYVTGNAAWITFDVVGPYDSLSLLTATIPDPASNIDVKFGEHRLTVSDGYVKLPPDLNAPSKNSGDANGDSVVNMKDVLLIRKFIANLITDIDMESADANGDSVVNMKDVLMIRKYIAGLIEALGV